MAGTVLQSGIGAGSASITSTFGLTMSPALGATTVGKKLIFWVAKANDDVFSTPTGWTKDYAGPTSGSVERIAFYSKTVGSTSDTIPTIGGAGNSVTWTNATQILCGYVEVDGIGAFDQGAGNLSTANSTSRTTNATSALAATGWGLAVWIGGGSLTGRSYTNGFSEINAAVNGGGTVRGAYAAVLAGLASASTPSETMAWTSGSNTCRAGLAVYTETGGASQALAATPAVTTAMTAAVSAAVSLAGAPAVTTAMTAAASLNAAAAATPAATIGMTAALTVAHPLAATVVVTTAMTADLTDTPAGTALAATVAVQTAMTAATNVAHPLAATAAVTTTVAASTAAVARPLAATAAVTTAVTADTVVTRGLAATVGVTTGATAALTVAHPLAAVIAVQLALAADLTRSGPLSIDHGVWFLGDPDPRWTTDIDLEPRWETGQAESHTELFYGPARARWVFGTPTRKEPS